MIEYQIKRTLDKETIKDILCTAIEGGIGYWACLCNDKEDWIEAKKNWRAKNDNKIPCYDDIAYEVLSNGKAVVLEDEEEEKEYELTMEKLANGCKLFEEQYKLIDSSLENGDFDSIDADSIIQLSLFGDVIYG